MSIYSLPRETVHRPCFVSIACDTVEAYRSSTSVTPIIRPDSRTPAAIPDNSAMRLARGNAVCMELDDQRSPRKIFHPRKAQYGANYNKSLRSSAVQSSIRVAVRLSGFEKTQPQGEYTRDGSSNARLSLPPSFSSSPLLLSPHPLLNTSSPCSRRTSFRMHSSIFHSYAP